MYLGLVELESLEIRSRRGSWRTYIVSSAFTDAIMWTSLRNGRARTGAAVIAVPSLPLTIAGSHQRLSVPNYCGIIVAIISISSIYKCMHINAIKRM